MTTIVGLKNIDLRSQDIGEGCDDSREKIADEKLEHLFKVMNDHEKMMEDFKKIISIHEERLSAHDNQHQWSTGRVNEVFEMEDMEAETGKKFDLFGSDAKGDGKSFVTKYQNFSQLLVVFTKWIIAIFLTLSR